MQARGAGENPYAYSVEQNLRDAGCADEMIEKFLSLRDGEQRLRLLSGHRKRLLERIHSDEKQIDCLDYLIYQLSRRDRA